MQQIDCSFVREHLPVRQAETNKNDYGRVLAICGCKGYTGAAYFAAQAAVRMGSGVVTLAVPEAIYPILAVKLNEPVVRPLPCDAEGKFSKEALPELYHLVSRADAMLLGSGLGRSDALDAMVWDLIQTAQCPMVLDADGINALSGHIDILRKAQAPVILTPHKGEFARISGVEPAQSEDAAQSFAQDTGSVLAAQEPSDSSIRAGRPTGAQYDRQSRHGQRGQWGCLGRDVALAARTRDSCL